MLTEKQKEALLKLAPRIKFEEPLKRHTYFKIGGPADAFYRYHDGFNYNPLRNLLYFCAQEKIPITVLGGGSNVLVSDQGLQGLVLQMKTHHLQLGYHTLEENPVYLEASGGDQVKVLAEFAEAIGLSGLEPFMGLPGTVGGAVYNNSHYKYHQLFGNFVTKVWTIPLPLTSRDRENFYQKGDLQFKYNYSRFQLYPHSELIIAVGLELLKGDKKEIRALTEKLMGERAAAQPLNVPSSGCIFKNPSAEISAGTLIGEAGLRGFKIESYEAIVSEKHPNFIINPHKKATARQVLTLTSHMRNEVLRTSGIVLEKEIFFLDNGKGGNHG